MLRHYLTEPPVSFVVEVPGWIVQLHAVVEPLLLPIAAVGLGLIALGGQAIVRHRRTHRLDRQADRAPAGADG